MDGAFNYVAKLLIIIHRKRHSNVLQPFSIKITEMLSVCHDI